MSASRDDALCAAGIEVWFDQSELRGGDAWDANTREQIETCALFVPLISVHTQSRREGYSRLEWKLADERTHLMAVGTAFLVPVVIDDTKERGALVPKSFLGVQWTRLPGGEVPAEFVTRVRALLGGKVAQASPLALRPEGGETAALHERRRFPKWVWGALAVVVVATGGVFRKPTTHERSRSST